MSRLRFLDCWAMCAWVLVILVVGCASPGAKKSDLTGKLVVGGSGSAYPTLTTLTTAFMRDYPRVQISFQPSSQSTTAVKYVADGKIDIGAIARPLNDGERSSEIFYLPIARDGVVLATHPNQPINVLTSQQIRDIYSGRIHTWSEVGGAAREIVTLDRTEGETAKIALRKYVLGDDLKIRPDVTILPTEQAMYESVAAVQDSLGYFSYAYVVQHPNKVRVIAIDGIVPSVETIQSGVFQTARTVGIVVKSAQKGNSPLREFLEFLSTSQARDALLKERLIPEVQR